MKWLEQVMTALLHGDVDPVVVIAVVVLVFGYFLHDQSKRAIAAIERMARKGNRG
jgi:hypothetical protein